MNELTNVDMTQKQQLPEPLKRGIKPAHSKGKLIISSLKIQCQDKEGNSMKQNQQRPRAP